MNSHKPLAVSVRVGCGLLVGAAAVLFREPTALAETPASPQKSIPSNEQESRLQSLRRFVENTTDLKAILDRYGRFIEQYKGTPAAAEAEKDAATWRQRLEKGMLKVGASWVTPAERDALKAQATETARRARDAMIGGFTKEAEALVRQALEQDPSNVGATYLNGLVLYQQNQVVPARKCFEAVVAALAKSPDGAALNNLAVMQSRVAQQGQQPPPSTGLTLYGQAMLASPGNAEILHNVAEALHALPANQRTTVVAENASRLYELQQSELVKKMERQGKFPWGTSWVDRPTLTKLEAAEKEIQKRVKTISDEYEKLQKSIDAIDGDVEGNRKVMQLMSNATSYRDASGKVVTRPLPVRYYDLQRQNEKLAKDRQGLVREQSSLRSQAALAERELPLQKFTGTQKLIGAGETPLFDQPKSAATTRATTKPS
jgi:tetratricopeptide (TPR) repeat protein